MTNKIDLTDNKPKLRLHWLGNVPMKCINCDPVSTDSEKIRIGGELVHASNQCHRCQGNGYEDVTVEVDLEVFLGIQDANWSLVVCREKFEDSEWFPLDKTPGKPMAEIIVESLLTRFQNGEPVEGVKEVSDE